MPSARSTKRGRPAPGTTCSAWTAWPPRTTSRRRTTSSSRSGTPDRFFRRDPGQYAQTIQDNFVAISRAFAVLRTAEKRAAYDKELKDAGRFPTAKPAGPTEGGNLPGFEVNLGRGGARARRGDDLERDAGPREEDRDDRGEQDQAAALGAVRARGGVLRRGQGGRRGGSVDQGRIRSTSRPATTRATRPTRSSTRRSRSGPGRAARRTTSSSPSRPRATRSRRRRSRTCTRRSSAIPRRGRPTSGSAGSSTRTRTTVAAPSRRIAARASRRRRTPSTGSRSWSSTTRSG